MTSKHSDIHQLEHEIEILSAARSAIHAKLSSRIALLQQRRNHLLPIHLFPTEILTAIFLFAVRRDDTDDYDFPFCQLRNMLGVSRT